MNFQSPQLDLLAGKDFAGVAVHDSPIESETDGQRNGQREQQNESGHVPCERGGKTLAPRSGGMRRAHCGPPFAAGAGCGGDGTRWGGNCTGPV